MARRLRIQYPDAIYHVMARGNGRQDIVQDDADRGRLVACLERAVRRSGWVLYAFVFLTNHLHLVLKTPRPNLAKGMQLFLSSYANGWARRHRHCGHLFQGRYRTELVEDETDLWVLTRYVHLNPVRAGLAVDAGGLDMVELSRLFPPPRSPGLGGLRRVAGGLGRRVRTDRSGGILPSLRGGRSDYPACPPWAEARHGWLLGSERFLDRLRQQPRRSRPIATCRRERRLLRGLDLARVIEAVCSRYGVDRGQLATRGSRSPARAALAYLAKHHTESTRAELVPILGLSLPESVPNLSARFAALLQSESNARRDLLALELALGLS